MASWTPPVIHATAEDLAVTDYNGVANNTTFLYQHPYAAYYNSVSTTTASGVATQITLGGTTVSGYGFSISSNNLILPLTGIYNVMGAITLTTGGSGALPFMNAQIYVNGSSVAIGSTNPITTQFSSSNVACIISATAGATVGLYCFQNAGSSPTTVTGANQTFLHASFVGSQ